MTAFALMLGLQQLIVRLAPAARMNQTAKAAAA
jgi:hypothetical protein